jgi:hypothetical protein
VISAKHALKKRIIRIVNLLVRRNVLRAEELLQIEGVTRPKEDEEEKVEEVEPPRDTSFFEIRSSLRRGTHITLSAKEYPWIILEGFAEAAAQSGSMLRVRDTDDIPKQILQLISSKGGRNVILQRADATLYSSEIQ